MMKLGINVIYPLLFSKKETIIERSERDNVRYDVGLKISYSLKLYVDNEELFNTIDHVVSSIKKCWKSPLTGGGRGISEVG